MGRGGPMYGDEWKLDFGGEPVIMHTDNHYNLSENYMLLVTNVTAIKIK